jgi:hypothetical protein
MNQDLAQRYNSLTAANQLMPTAAQGIYPAQTGQESMESPDRAQFRQMVPSAPQSYASIPQPTAPVNPAGAKLMEALTMLFAIAQENPDVNDDLAKAGGMIQIAMGKLGINASDQSSYPTLT